MDYKDFCLHVGGKTDQPRRVVEEVSKAIVDYCLEILSEGDEWRLPGFGKFYMEASDKGKVKLVFKISKLGRKRLSDGAKELPTTIEDTIVV